VVLRISRRTPSRLRPALPKVLLTDRPANHFAGHFVFQFLFSVIN
jgi:hypothetical protein